MNQQNNDDGKSKDAITNTLEVTAEDGINGTTDKIQMRLREFQDSPDERLVKMTIDTVEQFLQALMLWHQNKMGMLHHMLQVPPGTVVTLGNNETAEETLVTLEGVALDGFKVGLTLAIMEMGKLPFLPVDADGNELELFDATGATASDNVH